MLLGDLVFESETLNDMFESLEGTGKLGAGRWGRLEGIREEAVGGMRTPVVVAISGSVGTHSFSAGKSSSSSN